MAERSAASRSLAAANGHGTADPPAVTAQIAVPGAAQMRLLGNRLARLLRAGDLVVLAGSLGAGKTTLVQGLGEGLAVRGPVTSPTFVIARVHPSLRGGPDLVHADAYRLGSRLEVDDLDLDADLDHSVTAVEWGEGLVEDLAAGHLRVTIDWPAPERAIGAGADGEPGNGRGGPEHALGGPEHALGGPKNAPGGPENAPGDEVRIVTVSGYGNRWDDAAGQLRSVLAEPLR
jgi:tRNA threonylcarbamoyladenosine biosynthesis protein TsaE